MSSKFQMKTQEPQNLRKIFHQLQKGLKSNHLSSSVEKKLTPFKRILESIKKTHSPGKMTRNPSVGKQNNQNFKESTQSSEQNQNQKELKDTQFLQLYNNDPIFKCRIQRLFNQQVKRAAKYSLNAPKMLSCDRLESTQDQQMQMRTTFKSRRSENQKIILSKLQGYKRLLKRQNSHQTNSSAQDNQ